MKVDLINLKPKTINRNHAIENNILLFISFTIQLVFSDNISKIKELIIKEYFITNQSYSWLIGFHLSSNAREGNCKKKNSFKRFKKILSIIISVKKLISELGSSLDKVKNVLKSFKSAFLMVWKENYYENIKQIIISNSLNLNIILIILWLFNDNRLMEIRARL